MRKVRDITGKDRSYMSSRLKIVMRWYNEAHRILKEIDNRVYEDSGII